MPAVHIPKYPIPLRRLATLAVPAALLCLGACSSQDEPLTWQDLDGPERTYVQRLVVLERAKALALADREYGSVVLDSLQAAWGDSALAETRAGVPDDPARSRLVHDYLLRVLVAEKDSLMEAPFERRLAAPLPEPAPLAAEREGE